MKKKTGLFLCLILLLNACAKQSNLQTEALKSLNVKAVIKNDVTTKAVINSAQFPVNSQIGIQILKNSDGLSYLPTGTTNVSFTVNGTGHFEPSENCFLSSVKAKLYAYYPFTAIENNKVLFDEVPISIPQTSNAFSDIDYMYATPLDQEISLIDNTNCNVNLVMNHAATQVSVLLFKDNYSGDGLLTSFSIEDREFTSHIKVNKIEPNDLKMNIKNGNITGGQKGIILRDLINPIQLQSLSVFPEFPSTVLNELKQQVDQYGVYALLAPASNIMAGDIRFGFVIDGIQYYVTNTSNISWEKGKQYIYKVRLSKSTLSISSVTITDWQPIIGDEMDIQ